MMLQSTNLNVTRSSLSLDILKSTNLQEKKNMFEKTRGNLNFQDQQLSYN